MELLFLGFVVEFAYVYRELCGRVVAVGTGDGLDLVADLDYCAGKTVG